MSHNNQARQPQPRDFEYISHFEAQALNLGTLTRLGENFPLGEGWYNLNLRFNNVVTIGTATGAIAEGELNLIKNVAIKTSMGETICNLPGRALYRIAQYQRGSAPRKDANAAASGTYRVSLPINFADFRMLRPTDTILNTWRYSYITLEVTYGTVADLYTTVGTASMTASIDVEIVRTRARLPGKALPLFQINYDSFSPIDASVATQIRLQISRDLAYKRLYAFECSAGSAGVPFSGVPADDVKATETIVGGTRTVAYKRIHEVIQDDNRMIYGLESPPAGFTVFDFVRDGSVNSALWSAEFPELLYQWTNKAGVAAADLVTLGYEAVRTLK